MSQMSPSAYHNGFLTTVYAIAARAQAQCQAFGDAPCHKTHNDDFKAIASASLVGWLVGFVWFGGLVGFSFSRV
jgi:hypothetical protein